uniref:Uncharacterized protein n=1 Tax=Cucumis melo TaxID=3656 RepID=A0A9I9E7G5_CUCME
MKLTRKLLNTVQQIVVFLIRCRTCNELPVREAFQPYSPDHFIIMIRHHIEQSISWIKSARRNLSKLEIKEFCCLLELLVKICPKKGGDIRSQRALCLSFDFAWAFSFSVEDNLIQLLRETKFDTFMQGEEDTSARLTVELFRLK